MEDEKFVRESSCVLLREAGFQVLGAGSAAQAKRIFATEPEQVDLLITDRGLPDGSGEALSIELTHDFPRLKTIFISGYPRQGRPVKNYLSKPFSSDALLEKISDVMSNGGQV